MLLPRLFCCYIYFLANHKIPTRVFQRGCGCGLHILPTLLVLVCVCVYSNSRNDVPRVVQRYGTIAAHTRRRASVLVVFVVFCMHMYSVAGLIRRTPPATFSDTAITDRHSYTTIFQLRAHWVRITWSIGLEKIVRTCAPGGSRTLDFLRARRAPYPLGQALRIVTSLVLVVFSFYSRSV